jgi:hypothetical protein
MLMPRSRRAVCALALSVLAATAAPAAARDAVRDCGDAADNGAGAFAVTAQGRGLTCRSALVVARAVPRRRSCSDATIDHCSLRGFNCFVAQVGKELYLARCANRSETKFIRFEFGS